jgi:hypothetical protein
VVKRVHHRGSTRHQGLNLHADFGSTAHTGYDTDAVMYFHFAHNTWLCGTNGSEAKAAILESRARKD